MGSQPQVLAQRNHIRRHSRVKRKHTPCPRHSIYDARPMPRDFPSALNRRRIRREMRARSRCNEVKRRICERFILNMNVEGFHLSKYFFGANKNAPPWRQTNIWIKFRHSTQTRMTLASATTQTETIESGLDKCVSYFNHLSSSIETIDYLFHQDKE